MVMTKREIFNRANSMICSGSHPKRATEWILSQSSTGLFDIAGKIGYRLRCVCVCGSERLKFPCEIKRGDTVSCGCWHRVCAAWVGKSQAKHGLEGTRAYSSWSSMMKRCYSETSSSLHRYGGRGITVCRRWHNVANFVKDMGQPKRGLSLDRIDNNGNYEPGNCRWATQKEQMNNVSYNRVITYLGERMTVAQAADRFGIKYSRLLCRLRRGWTPAEAITSRRYKKIKHIRKNAAKRNTSVRA